MLLDYEGMELEVVVNKPRRCLMRSFYIIEHLAKCWSNHISRVFLSHGGGPGITTAVSRPRPINFLALL